MTPLRQGPHRGLIVYITMTTFPAYHEHLSCETSWPILGREDPTNTQVGVGMSRTTDKVVTATFCLPVLFFSNNPGFRILLILPWLSVYHVAICQKIWHKRPAGYHTTWGPKFMACPLSLHLALNITKNKIHNSSLFVRQTQAHDS